MEKVRLIHRRFMALVMVGVMIAGLLSQVTYQAEAQALYVDATGSDVTFTQTDVSIKEEVFSGALLRR